MLAFSCGNNKAVDSIEEESDEPSTPKETSQNQNEIDDSQTVIKYLAMV